MSALQAGAVAIGGRAMLIIGPPGVGKSELALALIDRGAELIGDDGVLIAAEGNRLIVRPHPETRGVLEVRNLGLISVSVCDEAPVCMVLRLDPEAPRFVEEADTATIEGISIPSLAIAAGPVAVIKAELALNLFGLAPG